MMHGHEDHCDVLVVGGGAAGLVAARVAADALGSRGVVVLVERMTRPGAKLLLSGGGKCNVTHDASPDRLLEKGFGRTRERRFLRTACYAYTADDLRAFLAGYGVQTVVRADGKVFPASAMADDVLDALMSGVRHAGARVVTGTRVLELFDTGEGYLAGCGAVCFRTRKVILATGGISYGHTGSTGDGLDMARSLGHSIVSPGAALAPVFLKPLPGRSLAGKVLRGVVLHVTCGGKTVKAFGDILFTHKGVSGPAVLSLSRDVAELYGQGKDADVSIDLFPRLEHAGLEARLLDYTVAHGARQLSRFLGEESPLPAALVPFVCRRVELDGALRLAELQRSDRRRLVACLKRFLVGKVVSVPLAAGEVSSGGIPLQEIDPGTMASRISPGLYCCGELLDYAGEIGGFNLQAAFSTGWLAGTSAAASCQQDA
ncbi:NAD(P)/FAD-dependent oxidoreductase [Prosthecochloris sp. CIB 2401]|uniref:NAD(P)/FAD-dependent oxidoreductase n=1 Tax=Prosthecochloris sp. CIB 2401 TaxID=1868325 RepID=UPI00080A98EB|nr:aminoacetone oxidase family FAD-binding enzyme [Prosthecochloris sp. CIB 2401]ANT65011.1 putative FAD-binding dehydrogenase [Prosthecochloris sp. CIB 2401]